MDPEHYQLEQYHYIPLKNAQEVDSLLKCQQKIVFYHNLILDITDFDHPGSNLILKDHIGTDIASVYAKYKHSFTASIIICQRVIGRKHQQSIQQKTLEFYQNVLNSPIFKQQQRILRKFDFNRPLVQSFYTLTLQQVVSFTQIPKYFKNPQKIKIQSQTEEDNCVDNSLQCALIITILVAVLLIFQLFKSGFQICYLSYLVIGFFFVSFLEYFLHKYDYHRDIIKNSSFSGADIHHCFPNLQQYMPSHILLLMFILTFILNFSQIIYFTMGALILLICHNLSHQLTHTTNELNIEWITNLKIHHKKHHFRNQHAYYGIAMTLWDYPFRTRG